MQINPVFHLPKDLPDSIVVEIRFNKSNVMVMASLSAYSVTEPLGLTLGSQCTLETVLRGIYFLMIFLFGTKQLKQKRRQNW